MSAWQVSSSHIATLVDAAILHNDLDLSQSKYLGGCSYKSQEDFESSGYFDDMKAEIARGLTEKIRKIKEYEGI